MSMNHVIACARLLMKAGVNLIIEGPHGIGKTSIAIQLHQERRHELGQSFDSLDADTLEGREMAKYALVPENEFGLWASSAANLTIEELIGYPTRDENVGGRAVLRYLRSHNFLPPPDHKGGGMLVVDELNLSFVEVERAMMSIALEGRYLDYVLPPNIWIATSQNPATGDYQSRRLNPPTLNRFCIISARADSRETLAFFRKRDFDESIIDAISENPDDMLNPHQNKISSEITQVPTSRSWAYVNRVMKVATPEQIKELGLTIFTGLLGPSAASTFNKFAQDQGVKTIAIDEVLKNYGADADAYSCEDTSMAKWPETKIRRRVRSLVKKATVDVAILKLAMDKIVDELKVINGSVREDLKVRREKDDKETKFVHTPEQRTAVLNIMAFLCDLPPDVSGLAFLNQIVDEYDATMGLYEDSQMMEDYYNHYHVRVTKSLGEVTES